MEKIILAFITGLTTGGLSCLAVQGGLLVGSLANQVEHDLQQSGNKKDGNRNQKTGFQFTYPIVIFLLAKIIAYTILGFLLGWIGQLFQLSIYTRAILQIGIGVFMLGNALRMLNVHPIFHYFAFEPPTFIRRWVRKTSGSSQSSSALLPAFLGILTVLMPCGVTQAMMAAAMATANPLQAAMLMAAFTIGTSPVFFAVMYFSFQLGAKLEKYFMKFVAVVLLIFALITIDSGITLAGSPISITRFISGLDNKSESGSVISPQFTLTPDLTDQGNPTAGVVNSENVVTIRVRNDGYFPNQIHVKAGSPIQLILVSENVTSCARSFIIPKFDIQKLLTATGQVVLELPAQEEGMVIPFSCSMGMYTGTIVVDQ